MKTEPFRAEQDSLGKVRIPKDKLWGAQSQRSLENFKIGQDKMPLELIHSLALIKECAAKTNAELGLLDSKKAKWIEKSAREIQEGRLNDHFPLKVWQTGSGTQSNMNVNEVIANRAAQLSGRELGLRNLFHPNDDVNKSQSSNDVFPSAMRICLYVFSQKSLLPALKLFEQALKRKVIEFQKIIKTGRTHLMDAVPISVGQEFSAFHQQIVFCKKGIEERLPRLLLLPLGGTALGTGLNSAPSFGPRICKHISQKTGFGFSCAKNKFESISAHDCIVELSSSFKGLAVSLMKIANDIRLLASGPRCGLGELILPANEPGSSIMPGKVNPTQCEALSMVCAQVIGQDLIVSLGGSGGHLQLNAFKPLILFNSLKSARLLSDSLNSFREKALDGLKANKQTIQKHLENSLMPVTALNPHIGYDKSAKIAKAALKNGTTLKEEASRLGFLTEKEFDRLIQPREMIRANLRPKTHKKK